MYNTCGRLCASRMCKRIEGPYWYLLAHACRNWRFCCLRLYRSFYRNVHCLNTFCRHQFQELEHKIIFLTKKELKRIKGVLSPHYSAISEREEEEVDEGESRVRQGLLQITLNVLRRMNKTNLANILQTSKSSESYYHDVNVQIILKILGFKESTTMNEIQKLFIHSCW